MNKRKVGLIDDPTIPIRLGERLYYTSIQTSSHEATNII